MNAELNSLIVFLVIFGLVDREYANCPWPNQPFPFIDAKCQVTKADGTEVVCEKDILKTSLKINVKVKKCDTPIAVDVTIKTTSYQWYEKFNSTQMSRDIPHSGNPNIKLRLRISLDITTTTIGFKVIIVTGFEQDGIRRFNINSSTDLIDGKLKRCTNECAATIKQGHDTLSGGEIAGIIVGSIIGFVLLCVVCLCLVSYSLHGGRHYKPDGLV